MAELRQSVPDRLPSSGGRCWPASTETKMMPLQWLFAFIVAGLVLLTPRRLFQPLHRWGWPALLLMLAGVALVAAACDIVDPDEVQHLHASWLVQQGLTPFRDFFEHHPPLFWSTAGKLIHATQPVPDASIFFKAKLLGAFSAVLAAAGLFWLARELRVNPTIGLVVLLAPLWWRGAQQFRPEGLAMALSLAAVAAIVRAGRRNSPVWAAASGISLALAAGLVVKIWAVGLAWLLLLAWLATSRRWKLLAAALGGAAIAGGLVAVHAFWLADWGDLRRCLIDANAMRQKVLHRMPWDGYLKFLLFTCPAVGLAAILPLLHVRSWRARPALPVAWALLVFSVAMVAVQQRWYSFHYYLPSVLLTAVVVMVLLEHIRAGPPQAARWWYGKALLAAVAFFSVVQIGPYLRGLAGETAVLRAQHERLISEVLRHVEPGQKVIASIPVHPIWAVDSRGWFAPPVMFRAGAKLGWWPGRPPQFADWLAGDPPDVVVAPVGKPGPGWNDPFLVQPNFHRWLERQYRPVGEGEFWRTTYHIWKRTSHSPPNR